MGGDARRALRPRRLAVPAGDRRQAGREPALSGAARGGSTIRDGATWNGNLPPWQPEELGLPRAVAIAVTSVGLVLLGVWLGSRLHRRQQQTPIHVTYVHMVQPQQQPKLPKPPPQVQPPPPLPTPPPQVQQPPPLPRPPPMTLPKPAPKPPPPKPHPRPKHRPKPKPKPQPKPHHEAKHRPQSQPKPQPQPRSQPQAKSQPRSQPTPSFNFEAYAARLRDAIQRNVQVSRAIRTLGLSGTAVVEFKLDPDGHLDWVKIYKSSGNPLIDRAAKQAVRRTHASGFPGNQPKVFAVPIEIRTTGGQ